MTQMLLRSILAVDDDEEFLDYLKTALAKKDCAVVTATLGGQAVQLIAQQRFALVLSDLRLPDMSGLDVLEAARRADPLTVGIVMTAHGSVETALEAMREGAYDYLLKPASPDLLHAAVHRGLEHYELKRALIHKTAELERLEKKLSEKSVMIQNVSHELKNPLTVVHGYSSYLLRQEPHLYKPEELKKNLQSIHKNAQRLGHLLEELLESARLSGNKIALEREATSVQQLIEEAVDDVRFEALKKELSVRVDLGTAVSLLIHADPKRIHQVLLNLLTNAVKFTPAGGAITISAQEAEGFVRFQVQDTGVGISPADMPRLFERFYQAQETRLTHKGLGLGLEICKGLVEMHGGKIWAESTPDRGSSFYFTLPISTHPEPKRNDASRSKAIP